jgi:purine-nucleoside phosphorylase
MEAAGLYGIASELGVRALAVLTVSDHLITQIETTSQERERSFDDMVVVALEALRKDAA